VEEPADPVNARHRLPNPCTYTNESSTAIAEKLGVSRRTVYHWIETSQLDRNLDAEPVRYAPRPPVPWKLDPYGVKGHPNLRTWGTPGTPTFAHQLPCFTRGDFLLSWPWAEPA
jgi:hypothetical protein